MTTGSPAPDEAPELLPISMLNALVYCPRRFFYEFAQGEMLVNAHVLAGRVHHERVDTQGYRTGAQGLALRRVYLFSQRLRLAGLADMVEVTPGTADAPPEPRPASYPLADGEEEAVLDPQAEIVPVEYKKGSAQGGGLNDQVQLCAQGLCLEEQTGKTVAGGYLFSFRTQHRTWVPFTPELRRQTEEAIERAFVLLQRGVLPPPLPASEARKCRDCSLEPLCLPDEVRALNGN
jgi:CRISPR-associated exonuclease Cas4